MIKTLFKILKQEFKICISTSSGSEEFIKLVKRHHEHAKLIEKLNEMFSKIFLINVTSCLLLCFYTFLATSTNDLAKTLIFVGHLQVLLLELYEICHMAQLVTEASADIASGVYNTIWYENNDKAFLSGFKIVQMQKPITLKAGQFAAMNIATFTSVKFEIFIFFHLSRILLFPDY